MNLSTILRAKRDRYARSMGALVIDSQTDVRRIGDKSAVWEFLRALGGKQFRVIYRAESGNVGDWIGRQGVHDSKQDGTVAGIGHAMASAENLTISFHTVAYGDKVNTGAGKGYRTLRADRVLAIKVNGTVILTDEGVLAIGKEKAKG